MSCSCGSVRAPTGLSLGKEAFKERKERDETAVESANNHVSQRQFVLQTLKPLQIIQMSQTKENTRFKRNEKVISGRFGGGNVDDLSSRASRSPMWTAKAVRVFFAWFPRGFLCTLWQRKTVLMIEERCWQRSKGTE